MKRIITIILLLLPSLLFAKEYQYKKVRIQFCGGDNFGIDKVVTNNEAGNISIVGNTLKIDGKTYELKHCRQKNLYKAKGLKFKLDYQDKVLCNVEISSFSKISKYIIMDNSGIDDLTALQGK